MKTRIHKITKNLGLGKREVDSIISRPSDVYKARTAYGIVSTKDVYKAGTRYGTVSPTDIYKAGTYYGTVSSKDVYKAGRSKVQ